MTFLLTVIGVFSKVAWCVPMKNKSAASLVAALDTTFSKGWPQTLQTDQGLEFLNKSVQALLSKHGIHHFSTHNAETKASVVERFNRTLKTRMWRYFTKHQTWRYIDVLPDLVRSYNNTHHRSIGMAPSNVNGNVCTVTTVRACPSCTCRIACASASTKALSKRATRLTGAKRCSRYTRFTPPIHPCTACETISAKCWTAPSTNWSCRRCRYPSIKCTAWSRYCNAVRLVDERRLW